MDAFAVSICQGLIPSKHNKKDMEKIAFTFGFFQFSMTFLGGIAGKIVLPFVKGYEYIIPCIIFCGIAVFMLKEGWEQDRKSTRLNSSHANISYAVFCLKKKKILLTVLPSILFPQP